MVVVSAANAVRPIPIAIVLTANTVAIAAIASNVFDCFIFVICKFSCKESGMVYLRYFTSNAKKMVES